MNKIGFLCILLVVLSSASFVEIPSESIALMERDQLTDSELVIVRGLEQGVKRVMGGVLATAAVVAMASCGIFHDYMQPPMPLAISVSGLCIFATGLLLIYMSF